MININAAMIDIETMDTEDSSVVLSLGAVLFDSTAPPMFDRDRNVMQFISEFSIVDQVKAGRTISAGTVEWWLKTNSKEFGRLITEESAGASLEVELGELFALLADHQIKEVWAKGPSFDFGILKHAAKMYGLVVPWRYSDEHDLRTLMKKVPHAPKYPKKYLAQRAAHDAFDDAHFQTVTLQQILRKLDRLK